MEKEEGDYSRLRRKGTNWESVARVLGMRVQILIRPRQGVSVREPVNTSLLC